MTNPDLGAVTVASVHSTSVAHAWHRSVVELVGYDLTANGRVIRGGWLSTSCGADSLAQARNTTVQGFLDERQAEWLWWVDTDMGFRPDTVDRLVEAADPTERPIVGGLAFAWKEYGPDGMGGWRCAPRPTIFDWVRDPQSGVEGFQGRSRYPAHTLVRCAGTGSACLLVHRSVFERIREEHGPTWYDRVRGPAPDRLLIGEDLSFCMRAGSLDIPVHVHTGVPTSHAKTIWVSQEDYWAAATPPPATDPVAVLVPVLHRPGNAKPFMTSLRASTGLATVYAIHDRTDTKTAEAWRDAGASLVEFGSGNGRPGSFAEKVNYAYGRTEQPWVFLVGDDVHFHPGWLDHAQAVAADGYQVIGTNDLHNRRVTSGQHATHLLIARDYIDRHGASWDGPGVVCHPGYRHQFVDDEIVTAARQRDAWAMALGAHVEHLHPAWGGAPLDATYEHGQASGSSDQALFEQRLAAHTPAAAGVG